MTVEKKYCEACGEEFQLPEGWKFTWYPSEGWPWERKDFLVCQAHLDESYETIAGQVAERQRALVVASVFLDMWGSTTSLPERWERWAYTTDGCPEWVDNARAMNDSGDCVSVLDCSGDVVEVPGYKTIEHFACGEKECPWCGDSYRDEEHSPKREDCQLCEGDGVLYWGEEWQLVVLRRNHWICGSGMAGCLYDDGPHLCGSRESAIEHLVWQFEDDLTETQVETMKKALEENGIVHFNDVDVYLASHVGADYAEVKECDCDNPEVHDPDAS